MFVKNIAGVFGHFSTFLQSLCHVFPFWFVFSSILNETFVVKTRPFIFRKSI